MNEKRIAAARADMEQRVATFRAIQARFERERQEYGDETLAKARATSTPPRAPDARR